MGSEPALAPSGIGRHVDPRPVPEPVARRPEAGIGQQLGVGVDPGAEGVAARRTTGASKASAMGARTWRRRCETVS